MLQLWNSLDLKSAPVLDLDYICWVFFSGSHGDVILDFQMQILRSGYMVTSLHLGKNWELKKRLSRIIIFFNHVSDSLLEITFSLGR